MPRSVRLLIAIFSAVVLIGSCRADTTPKDDKKLRVVIFGAHPDDPESGCGGLIALLTRSGHDVVVAYATCYRGERKIGAEPEATVRRREATAACQVLGAKAHFFDYAHEKLQADEATLAVVSAWLKKTKPDVVVTHWPLDTHPNHHVTSSLIWQSYLQEKSWTLYAFEVMTDQQTQVFRPELYLDIESVRPMKRRSLDCHQSQKPDGIWEVHEAMHRRRGKECGVNHAEAYTLLGQPKNGPLLPVSFLRQNGEAANNAPKPVRTIDPDRETGTAAAVVVEDQALIHTAQLLPLDKDGKPVGKDAATQVAQVLDNLTAVLAEAQSRMERVIKVNFYVTRPETVAVIKKALSSKFTGESKPAVSFVAGTLAHPDALVAMDAVATTSRDAAAAVKHFQSPKLPAQVGAHAAVLPAGARVYISGQAVKGKDLVDSTRQTLASLRETLKHLGLSEKDVVQAKAFLTPIAGAADVRKELAQFFGEPSVPPTAFVEWISPLPIEIELIAWAGKAKDGEAIEFLTPPGVQPSPVYSRITRINHGPQIYISGLYAPQAKDAESEVHEVFGVLESVLKKSGSDFRHLAKATYYVATDDVSRKLNELRPKYYDPRRPPAASKAAVAGVGVEGRQLTLDMIAVPAPLKPKP